MKSSDLRVYKDNSRPVVFEDKRFKEKHKKKLVEYQIVMDKIKSIITYENINLTIQTLMMVATFMAAFIALNQLKLSQKMKLKINVKYQYSITGDLAYPNCIELQVTNVGNRIIEIAYWGIDAKNNKQLQIVDSFGINNNLPYKLQIEETKMLLYPLGLLK